MGGFRGLLDDGPVSSQDSMSSMGGMGGGMSSVSGSMGGMGSSMNGSLMGGLGANPAPSPMQPGYGGAPMSLGYPSLFPMLPSPMFPHYPSMQNPYNPTNPLSAMGHMGMGSHMPPHGSGLPPP
jgi:hypothetical protein